MTITVWESEIWLKVQAALFGPVASIAVVNDVGSGVQLTFSELGKSVLQLYSCLEKWVAESIESNNTGEAACDEHPTAPYDQQPHRSEPVNEEVDRLSFGNSNTIKGDMLDDEQLSAPPLVAIYCHASAEYMAMTLAVLAAGATFLPLDPAWPAPRLATVLQLARPRVLLTTPALRPQLPAPIPPSCRVRVVLPYAVTQGPVPSATQLGGEVPYTDRQQRDDANDEGPVTDITAANRPTATSESATATAVAGKAVHTTLRCRRTLPYFAVLYTSGSTGTPLGVRMSEAAWLARIRWMQQRFPLLPPKPPYDPPYDPVPRPGQRVVPVKSPAMCTEPQRSPLAGLSGPDCGGDREPGSDGAAGSLEYDNGHADHTAEYGSSGGEVGVGEGGDGRGSEHSGRGSVVCFSTAVSFVDHLWQLLAPLLGPEGSGRGTSQELREEGRAGAEAEAEAEAGASTGKEGVEAGCRRQEGGAGGAGGTSDSGLATTAAAAAEARAGAGPCHVVIPPPGFVAVHPGGFVELLAAYGVTHLVSVPSLLRRLLPSLRAAGPHLTALRLLVSSGEPLHTHLAEELRKVLEAQPPAAQLLNLYGCTEVTADCTWYLVAPPGHQATLPGSSGGGGDTGVSGDIDPAPATRPPVRYSSLDTSPSRNPQPPIREDYAVSSNVTAVAAPAAAAVTATDDNGNGNDNDHELEGGTPWVPAGWPLGDTHILIAPVEAAGEADQGAAGPSGTWAVHNTGGSNCKGASDAATSSSAGASTADRSRDTAGLLGGCGPTCGVRPLPAGRVGEVWVAGICLSGGYHTPQPLRAEKEVPVGGRPAGWTRTAEANAAAAAAVMSAAARRFVRVRLSEEQARRVLTAPGVAVVRERVYFRTGDLGRVTSDGCLQLLGRLDSQVKLAGVRLDLTEVEAALVRHPHVRDAAVRAFPRQTAPSAGVALTAPPQSNTPLLVAYIVLAAEEQATATDRLLSVTQPWSRSGSGSESGSEPQPVDATLAFELRRWVAQHLPTGGGLPLRCVALPHLPRNPAGKLLRNQLPALPPPLPPLPPSHPGSQLLRPSSTTEPSSHVPYNHRISPSSPPVEQAAVTWTHGLVQPTGGQGLPASRVPLSETDVMRAIVAVTGLVGLEATTDIFEAGATSLQAAELAGVLGTDVRLLLAAPTPRRLAAALRNAAVVFPASSGRNPGSGRMDAEAGPGRVADGLGGLGGGSGTPAFRGRVMAATDPHGGGRSDPSGGVKQGPGEGFAPLPAAKRPRLDTLVTPAPVSAARTALLAPLAGGAGGGQRPVDGGDEGSILSRRPQTVCLQEAIRTCCQLVWRAGGGGRVAGPYGGVLHTTPTGLQDDGASGAAGWCGLPEMVPAGGWPGDLGSACGGPGADPGSRAEDQRLRGLWRYPLGRCVDAPVLLVTLSYREPREPVGGGEQLGGAGGSNRGRGGEVGAREVVRDKEGGNAGVKDAHDIGDENYAVTTAGGAVLHVRPLSVVLACSHDGDVACLDPATGSPYWHTRLPSRAEAGMAVAWGAGCSAAIPPLPGGHVPYVVVACGDGKLYSLDLGSGRMCGAVDGGGEFKCPPVCDPWVGAVWATGHGRQLTVMRPPAQVLARKHIGAPMSTPLAFACLPHGPQPHPSQPPQPPNSPHLHPPNQDIGPPGGDPPSSNVMVAHRPCALLTTLDGRTICLQVTLPPPPPPPSLAPPPAAPPPAPAPPGAHQSCVGALSSAHTDLQDTSQASRGRNGEGAMIGPSPCPSSSEYGQPWGPVAAEVRLEVVWTLRGTAPVFSAPLVLGPLLSTGALGAGSLAPPDAARAAGGQQPGVGADAVAVVGHVDGLVRAVLLGAVGAWAVADDEPAVLWSRQLQGNLFADLTYLHTGEEAEAQTAAGSPVLPAIAASQTARQTVTLRTAPGLVLAATHLGFLYGLDPLYGTMLLSVDLSCGPISATPEPAGWAPPPPPASTSSTSATGSHAQHIGTQQPYRSLSDSSRLQPLIMICSSSGCIMVLQLARSSSVVDMSAAEDCHQPQAADSESAPGRGPADGQSAQPSGGAPKYKIQEAESDMTDDMAAEASGGAREEGGGAGASEEENGPVRRLHAVLVAEGRLPGEVFSSPFAVSYSGMMRPNEVLRHGHGAQAVPSPHRFRHARDQSPQTLPPGGAGRNWDDDNTTTERQQVRDGALATPGPGPMGGCLRVVVFVGCRDDCVYAVESWVGLGRG